MKLLIYGPFVFILLLIILLLCIISGCSSWCGTEYIGNNPDLYCSYDYLSNDSYFYGADECVSVVHNATQERIAREKVAAEAQAAAIVQACWDNGTSWNESYDLISDYNYTCAELKYLNDHLVDNYVAKDGGRIMNSYHGLLSSNTVDVQIIQYVNERISATGQLPKMIRFHKDCNGNVTVERQDYSVPDGCIRISSTTYTCGVGVTSPLAIWDYTTADFMMYYAKICVED